ncbi:hypothetical protein [Magnetospirillum gryphiswaldense]|nr:hypothetical protein [Magnetospirillum gryphiswaldense]
MNCAVAGLDPDRWKPDLAEELEQAFDAGLDDWLKAAVDLGGRADAVLAHMPSMAANISDYGVTLAWVRLVRQWATGSDSVLVLCDDPWLFRSLATVPGVRAGAAPNLWRPALKLRLRGLAARVAVSLRMAKTAWLSRGHGARIPTGRPWLLVYGHPSSQADGQDAYFGALMKDIPSLMRGLHVDCPPARAAALAGQGRSLSLHGFGTPLHALGLWRRTWRPPVEAGDWLLRRVRDHEAGGGGAAMTAWQIHCQQRWLARVQPSVIAWPWENHGWERALVRAARAAGVATIGYQHAAVGRREWNYAVRGNSDGRGSLPDRILCVGDVHAERLRLLGCPAEMLEVGGALRFADTTMPVHDSSAPLFVALPFDSAIAAEMVEAVRPLAQAGRRVLVRDHPMSPFPFRPSLNLEHCAVPLPQVPAVSVVLYCITTVGLEAMLAGLPTIRFIPTSRPAVDISPEGYAVPCATAKSLAQVLAHPDAPPPLDRQRVFAPINHQRWRALLAGEP